MKSFDDISPMLIGAEEKKPFDFENDNIILLQATRVISRKRIEVNFTLVNKLFGDEEFFAFFEKNKDLKITLLVTGPIATGHFNYFRQLLEHFNLSLIHI